MNQLKYRIPIIGKIIKSRDILEVERDNLLIKLRHRQKSIIRVNFSKIIKQHPTGLTGIEKYLKHKKNIFDIGTGPSGSYWWQNVDANALITGIDLLFFPKILPNYVKIYKFDASAINGIKFSNIIERYTPPNHFKKERVRWKHKYDMVVANHVLEHVASPENLIQGIGRLIKKGGIVYCGFPDFRNFTDIFYHLIHPNGGGHIQQLTNQMVQRLFNQSGFDLIECNIWPDDWGWLQHQYIPENFGIKHINRSQLEYLCDVFRRELTPDRGYFYGWEMIFKKR